MDQDNAIEDLARMLGQRTAGKAKQAAGAPLGRVAEIALSMIAQYCERINDALAMYRPVSKEAADFHACKDRTRLLVGGNQSGKTQTSEAEFCRIWRGVDPYKKRKAKNLRMLAVGKDGDHIGQVMFKKIWWPGAFDIIRDKETGAWRCVRPDPENPNVVDPGDIERKGEWMPSPPMVPPAEIKEIAWDKKNLNIPRKVTLKNGSEALFHSSKGYPRQGIELDVFHCDEELENKNWITESQARLLKRDGIMFASYTPQASTPEYYAMHRRVMEEEKDISEFTLSLDENPYIPVAAKKSLFNSLKDDPDELAVRYYGKYGIVGRQCYPEYSVQRHCIDAFTIPDDWMRIVTVDPGARFQTALFAAVPPEYDKIHIYDLIHREGANARILAQEVKEILGQMVPEVFIIDRRGGQQRPMGYSNTVADHYSSEFESAKLQSNLSGSSFVWGSDEVGGREQSLKRWLRPGHEMDPIVQFHLGKTSKLDKQIKRRFYRKDDPRKREHRVVVDCVDCLEYLAAYFDPCIGRNDAGLYYSPPERVSPKLSPQYQAYQAMEKYYKKLEARNKSAQGISLG